MAAALRQTVYRAFIDGEPSTRGDGTPIPVAWYRRRRERYGTPQGKSGAVTVIQRVASDLRLHPHFPEFSWRACTPSSRTGGWSFTHLPRLDTTEVGDAAQVLRAR
jgi:hypothetical protein